MWIDFPTRRYISKEEIDSKKDGYNTTARGRNFIIMEKNGDMKTIHYEEYSEIIWSNDESLPPTTPSNRFNNYCYRLKTICLNEK
jgi:hypothetical protein